MFERGDKVVHKFSGTVMVVAKVIGDLVVPKGIETVLLVEWFDGTNFKQKQLSASSLELLHCNQTNLVPLQNCSHSSCRLEVGISI
jgi:hypothetical protein